MQLRRLVIQTLNNNQLFKMDKKMKQIKTLIFLFTVLIPGLTLAHGPTPQKVDESIIIEATPDEVWGLISQFDAINQWHPEVTAIELTDDTTRRLTLENGEIFTESLDDRNKETYSVSYRLLEENFAAIPVSFYTITLQAQSMGNNQTSLSWSGRFYRADTGNFPPEELNDDAAVAAMTSFAEAGLAGIKDVIEK